MSASVQTRLAALPASTHPIGVEHRCIADELNALHSRLRDQHAIERVAINQGQTPCLARVRERDREFEHPLRAQMVFDVEQHPHYRSHARRRRR